MRQWVTPRSLMLHLAFIVIASGCLIAAWWQVHRAMAGNTLSYLYSVEWPAFAVVAGIGWWQMFHDTPEDIAERKAHHARMRAASAEVVARTLPRSALAITVSADEIDGSGQLPRPDGTAALTSGDADPAGAEIEAIRVPGSMPQGRQADAALLADEGDEPVDELEAYNRYLALLAVRGRAKTWRNPPRAIAAGGALTRYRVMAYAVGVMLIVVFASIPFQGVEHVVGPTHGALYIIYLLAGLDLVRRARLSLWVLAAMVAAGLVPVLAFVVERWVTAQVRTKPAAGD